MEEQSIWESLDLSYYNITAECNDLSNMLFPKGNIMDGYMMKEIHDRMELIHYKAEVLILFIKTLKAAEAENVDLGDNINGAVNFHFTIFISDLDLDIKNCFPHYFAYMECHELFCRWQKLCALYKDYFIKTVELPKSIDLSTYELAMEDTE